MTWQRLSSVETKRLTGRIRCDGLRLAVLSADSPVCLFFFYSKYLFSPCLLSTHTHTHTCTHAQTKPAEADINYSP